MDRCSPLLPPKLRNRENAWRGLDEPCPSFSVCPKIPGSCFSWFHREATAGPPGWGGEAALRTPVRGAGCAQARHSLRREAGQRRPRWLRGGNRLVCMLRNGSANSGIRLSHKKDQSPDRSTRGMSLKDTMLRELSQRTSIVGFLLREPSTAGRDSRRLTAAGAEGG